MNNSKKKIGFILLGKLFTYIDFVSLVDDSHIYVSNPVFSLFL